MLKISTMSEPKRLFFLALGCLSRIGSNLCEGEISIYTHTPLANVPSLSFVSSNAGTIRFFSEEGESDQLGRKGT